LAKYFNYLKGFGDEDEETDGGRYEDFNVLKLTE